MKRRKTNIICSICKKAIYTNEGFLPGNNPVHMYSCTNKLKTNQVRTFEPSDSKKEKKPSYRLSPNETGCRMRLNLDKVDI